MSSTARHGILPLVMAAWSLAASAEPSGDEYRSRQAAPATQADRQRLSMELQQQRLREDFVRAEREAAARIEAERHATLRAQRPLGERLTESRCMPCHSLAVVMQQPRGSIGWRWTIERMRWWHGAALGRDEVAIIGRHLSAAQAAGPWRVALEWSVAGVVLGAVLAAAIALILKLLRRRTMSS